MGRSQGEKSRMSVKRTLGISRPNRRYGRFDPSHSRAQAFPDLHDGVKASDRAFAFGSTSVRGRGPEPRSRVHVGAPGILGGFALEEAHFSEVRIETRASAGDELDYPLGENDLLVCERVNLGV